MEPQPILIRFLRTFIGQWRMAKQAPTQCKWRGGVRPCFRCWTITLGHTMRYAICDGCQQEDNDQICLYCGTTRQEGQCVCSSDYYSQPTDYDDYDEYDEYKRDEDISGPCRECGREIHLSDWACYGYCSRYCAVTIQNRRERGGGRW